MSMISTITPIKIFKMPDGTPSRSLDRLDVQLKSLRSQTVESENIIVDSSEEPFNSTVKDIAEKNGAKYIFVETNLIFNKPLLLNTGILNSSGEYLGILDLDIFLRNDVLEKSLKKIKECDTIVGTTYNILEPKDDYFSGTYNLKKTRNDIGYSEGGYVFYSKKLIQGIGLYDRNFDLWGGPDNEIMYRFIILQKKIERSIFDKEPSVFHIPHVSRSCPHLSKEFVEKNNFYNRKHLHSNILTGKYILQNNDADENKISGTRLMSDGRIVFKEFN